MLGQDVVRIAPGAIGYSQRSSTSPTRPRSRRARAARARRGRSTAPPGPTWTAPRSDEDEATARQPRRRAQRGRGRAARVVYVSTDYVFDGAQAASRTSSPTRSTRSRAYGRTKLEGERAAAAPTRATSIVRSSWLFGAGGQELRRDHAAAAGAARCAWSTTRSAARPSPGHLAGGAAPSWPRSEDFGVHHLAAPAPARGSSSPARSSRGPARPARRALHHGRVPAPRARDRPTRRSPASAATRRCPPGRRASTRYLRAWVRA